MIEKVVWYEPLLETKLYEGEAMDQKMHGYGKLYYPENVNDPRISPYVTKVTFTRTSCMVLEPFIDVME